MTFFMCPYGPEPGPPSGALADYFGTFIEKFWWGSQHAFFRFRSDTNHFGQMRVQFHLNSDGHVSDLIVLTNTVGAELGQRFENIFTARPFEAWPAEVRRTQYAGYVTIRSGLRFDPALTNSARMVVDPTVSYLWPAIDPTINDAPQVWTNFASDPAYLATGALRERTNNYAAAIIEYTKAIEWDPQDAWALNRRGVCRIRLKDYDQALSDLSSALNLDPQNASAWNNRAIVRQHLKDYPGVISDCTKAINLDSNFSGAYNNRAFAKKRLHDFAGALVDLKTCLDLAPTNTLALLNRSRVSFCLHDYAEAIFDCDRAIAIDPRNARAYASRGYILQEQQNTSAALESFTKAVEIDGSQIYPRFQIWAILCRSGQAASATNELLTHLETRPQTETGKWSSQIESFLVGSTTEPALLATAEQTAKTPQERSDQLCEATYYAGLRHLFAGEKDQAAALFQKSLATDDQDLIEYSRAGAELQQLQRR